MKRVAVLGLLLLTLPAARSAGAEIPGEVLEATGSKVRIKLKGDLLPQVGDPVKIVHEIAGTDIKALVGTGKVTEARGAVVLAEIDKKTSEVKPGYLAEITSERPTTGTQEPKTSTGTNPAGKVEPPRAVSYKDLLGLLEAKTPEDEILKAVQASPTRFTLDLAQEEELRKAGASDRVLAAVRSRLQEREAGDVLNIALILDCSGSMNDRTPDGLTRMEVARKAIGEFLDSLPNGRRLTFIIFGHDNNLECEAVLVVRPLTPLDDAGRAELKKTIDKLKPDGHTPLAKALRVAGGELAKGEGLCGVVVVTDGIETCKGNPAEEAAKLARDLKLRGGVNVIGLAIKAEERKELEKIAAGGGKFHPAESAKELAKVFQEVRQTIAAGPGLPEGISAAKGLTVPRWMAARRLTSYKLDDKERISHAKISAGGSHIIYSANTGVFVMDVDRRGEVKPVQLSAAPAAWRIDISADGKTVAWYDKDGLFVAKADGSDKTKLPGGFAVESLRLTAAGDRVFVLSSNPVAILTLPADGSALKRVASQADVGKLTKPSTWPHHFVNFDVSDDGKRVVFRFSLDVFVVNADGSDLRPLNETGVLTTGISGDGETVGYYIGFGKDANTLRFVGWDGKEKATYAKFGGAAVDALSLSRDGSKLGITRGLRVFRSDGKEYRNPLEIGGLDGPYAPFVGARGATLTADFRRACIIVDQWENTFPVSQLALVEFNPEKLAGVPTLQEISVTPRFFLNDGSNTATVTVRVKGGEVEAPKVALLREDVRIEPHWACEFGLKAAGKEGEDASAGRVFATEQARLTAGRGRVPTGPFTLRLSAADRHGNFLSVDLEGVNVDAP